MSPRLGRIRALTNTAADLDLVERSWRDVMGYQVVERLVVPDAMAASWGAPAVAGKAMLVLAPANGEPVHLRFVEQTDPVSFQPLRSLGWSVMELVVQDPRALSVRLADSAFEVVLEPHGVDGYPYLTALQAAGPSGERLNLTCIDPPQPDLPVAGVPVGQCFIATLGVPDIEAARAFYRDGFACPVTPVHHVRLSLVNVAHGLPRETRHPLVGVTLTGQSMIELDEFPGGAPLRPRPQGGLPAGLSIVSFETSGITALDMPLLGKPFANALFDGAMTRCVEGTAGEILELIDEDR